jgi:hypothetical protein
MEAPAQHGPTATAADFRCCLERVRISRVCGPRAVVRTALRGENKDTNCILSGVSEIGEKIGRACNWSDTSDDATGSIEPPQKHQNLR